MLLKRELPHFSIRLRKGSIFSDIVLIPKRGWRCPIKNTQTFSVPQIPHLIPPILHPPNANSNTHILSRQNLWFGFWECLQRALYSRFYDYLWYRDNCNARFKFSRSRDFFFSTNIRHIHLQRQFASLSLPAVLPGFAVPRDYIYRKRTFRIK